MTTTPNEPNIQPSQEPGADPTVIPDPGTDPGADPEVEPGVFAEDPSKADEDEQPGQMPESTNTEVGA